MKDVVITETPPWAPIYQWWNGPFEHAPDLIRYCHKTLVYHTPSVFLEIGNDWEWNNLRHDHKADYERVKILRERGGIWLDLDYLAWDDPRNVRLMVKGKLSVWRRKDGLLDNDFLASGAGAIGIYHLFRRVREVLAEAHFESYRLPTRGAIGADILNEMFAENPEWFFEVDADRLCPHRRMVLNLESWSTDPFIPDLGSTGMMLLHSLWTPELRKASVQELLHSETVIGAILRHADLRLPPPVRECPLEIARKFGAL
jgi:hypothetical protein